MIFCKLISNILFRDKCVLLPEKCFGRKSLKGNLFPVRRSSNSPELIDVSPEKNSQRKLLKVAILGRPNTGKSTLINRIMDLNVCDVSSKAHTTCIPLKAAFVSGDTQIVFVDTPGVVTKKEIRRFSLTEEFVKWKETVFEEVDLVGIVYDAPFVESHMFRNSLIRTVNEVPETKPKFLIINKIDLIKNRVEFLEVLDKLNHPKGSEGPDESGSLRQFSKIFVISALTNSGVNDIVEYLLLKAKPDEWLLEPGNVCDTPLHLLITNLLRAKMFNILPEEIPYKCLYEVEYLKKDELGCVYCVTLITCKCTRHLHMIVRKRKTLLRKLCQELESDLYKILKTVFQLRIIVATKKHKV